jgi:tRNA A-37 threonylcarbamoyl transferase component Bud32
MLDKEPCQVVKERVVKRYRHPALEASLSKKRLNMEARCILRARKNGVAAPCIYHIDYEAARIYMSFVVGQTLKDWLMALPNNDEIDSKLTTVGQSIASLHDADVVHGDLTSSNIMVSACKAACIHFSGSIEAYHTCDWFVYTACITCFVRFPFCFYEPLMCILCTTQVVSDDTGSCCLIDFGLSYVSGMPEDKVIICFCEGVLCDNVHVGNVLASEGWCDRYKYALQTKKT